MTNPFAEYAAPQTGAQNPFSVYKNQPPAEPEELDVIAKTNSQVADTPDSFGLVEVSKNIAEGIADFLPDVGRGFGNFLLSTPQIAGASLVEAGELSVDAKGVNPATVAKKSFLNRIVRDYQEEGGANIFKLGAAVIGSEKDALLSLFSDGDAPKVLINAGNALIEKNQAWLQSNGLVKKGSSSLPYDIGTGLGSVLVSVGTTVLTRNPTLAAGFTGALVNSQDYREARAAGKSPEESAQLAAASAYGQGLIEFIGGKYFLSASQGSTFLRKFLARTGMQGLEETAQATVEEAVKGVSGVRDDSLEEKVVRIGYQGMIGLIVGAPVSAVVSKMEKAADILDVPPLAAKKIIDNFMIDKDAIVDAATAFIDKERSGVMNTLPEESAASKAVKNVFSDVQAIEDAEKSGSTDDARVAAKIMLRNEIPAEARAEIKNLLKTDFTMGDLSKVFDRYMLPSDNDRPVISELSNGAIEVKSIDGGRTLSLRDDGANVRVEFASGTQKESDLRAAVDYSLAKERRFVSGSTISDSQVRFYRKLEDAGYSVEENSTIRREGNWFVSDDGNPVYVVSGIDSETALSSNSRAELFRRVIEEERKSGVNITEKVKENLADLKRMLGKAFVPISTRLGNISPKLKARLRKYQFTTDARINADQAKILPFLEKWNALPREDRAILDFSMKNGDVSTIEEIAKKHNMEKEIAQTREVLEAIYARAKSVGYELGYLKNFFPRHVTKPEALLQYFERTEEWAAISQAFRNKELELGRFLTQEEKASLLNTLLRGYKVAQITLSKPGALKERSIDQITPEIMNFYSTTDQAIIRYVVVVNDAIEARKFFGKSSPGNVFENVEESIGAFAIDQLTKGTIKPSQVDELQRILQARFNQGRMSTAVRVYRNFSYIDTMGSPVSAITQIGDLANALYKNGVYRTLKALVPAIAGKSEVTRKDINVEQIAQEFSEGGTSAKAVKEIFKLTGLQKMDSIGKETLINSSLQRFRKLAKAPTQEFKESLEVIFEEETDAVISDLQNGIISENVKLLLFNELLDFQPISLSEMPEAYLRMGNGRIFYMLKMFTIKQFDVYRREIFSQMGSNPVRAIRNLVRLAAFFVVMNAGADFLKDLVLNRETPPEDYVINNMLRIIGISKFQVYTARREGLGTSIGKTILPPFKAIDALYKDMAKAIKKGEVDINNLKSVDSVPIVGKFYYWWFGAGAEQSDKARKKSLSTP